MPSHFAELSRTRLVLARCGYQPRISKMANLRRNPACMISGCFHSKNNILHCSLSVQYCKSLLLKFPDQSKYPFKGKAVPKLSSVPIFCPAGAMLTAEVFKKKS